MSLRGTPATAEEFGAGLRALRVVSLRELEARQANHSGLLVISKSQLDRYETGKTLPPLKHAKHLDSLYEAGGWVLLALRGLWRSRWNPWDPEYAGPSRIHAGGWPADFAGMVWIKIKPTAENIGKRHSFKLRWGFWSRRVGGLRLTNEGVLLVTGKAEDQGGIALTCNLTATPEVYALFGAGGSLGDEHVIDIRRGWRLSPG